MKRCSVREFGARGDGITKDTAAIQAAIDACSAAGGGTVLLAEGRFLCGRIDLKSGVELRLDRDAVLLFSSDVNDFPEIETDFWKTEFAPRFNRRCMIYAENCEDIALTGRGVIDCNGMAYVESMTEEMIASHPHQSYWRKPFPTPEAKNRDQKELDHLSPAVRSDPALTSLAPARVAFFAGCRNVLVEGITMKNQPGGWSYWVSGCENVAFHRCTVAAAVDIPNNDGLHINCCRNVTVSDCNITSGDDCIVVRAYSAPLGKDTPCEKVTVTNCNLTSHACAVRVGWIGDGVIRDLTFSNLTVTDTCIGIGMRLHGNAGPRLSDEGTEATLIENVRFSNIVMDRLLKRPVFIEIGSPNLCRAIREIRFNGVSARSARMPAVIGREDCPVENVSFTDCRFQQISYEEMHSFFGDRFARYDNRLEPAVFRHVKNLRLDGTEFDAR